VLDAFKTDSFSIDGVLPAGEVSTHAMEIVDSHDSDGGHRRRRAHA